MYTVVVVDPANHCNLTKLTDVNIINASETLDLVSLFGQIDFDLILIDGFDQRCFRQTVDAIRTIERVVKNMQYHRVAVAYPI